MWTILMLALCSSVPKDMRPSQCYEMCSENEQFVDNVHPCNTCEYSEGCTLTTVGGPGCDCVRGHYRNKEGKCVKKEKCKVGPPQPNQPVCRGDEVFLDCSCERTCCNGGLLEACASSCKRGCFCGEGLFRHEDGRCITLEQCEENRGGNGPTPGNPQPKCSIPKCGIDCSLDYSNKPCPRCKCKGTPPPVKCSIPRCGVDCSLDYSTKPCPSCKCQTLPSPNNCKPDEELYDCMPLCHGTCKAYLTKSFLFCKMACRSGCFCREGLYQSDDGRCVPASQCAAPNPPENSCGANEEYLECGSACPPTCENPGERMCTLQCVAGCFCKEGYLKNDQGMCVKPQQCQQGTQPVQCSPPKCPPGCSIDYTTEPCPSCACSDIPPEQCSMPMCAYGCEIDYSTKPCPSCSCLGTPPVQCSPPKCAPGCSIDYSTEPCPSCSCSGTQPIQCSPPKCAPGCRIDYSTEPCPSCSCSDKCGENEEYRSCGSACPTSCANLGQSVICTMQCVPGCFCARGLVRNDYGKCVPPEQCQQNSVTPTENPPTICSEDEEYQECGSVCPPSCSTLGRTDLACIALCVRGCFCKKGLVRNDEGHCVAPNKCPQAPRNQCGPRKQYYECIPRCSRTCEAYTRKPKTYCSQLCRSGCFCKEGLYETTDGKCVPPSRCPAVPPKKKCPKNEVYSDCAIPCNDCQTKGKCNFLVCNKGCDCRKGYYRDFNRRCIPARQCPIIEPTPPSNTCEVDQQHYECIPSCGRTCKAYRRKEKVLCKQLCISGCFCRDGLYLADDGKTCVPPEQCGKTTSLPTKPPVCPFNQQFYDCTPRCTRTCEGYYRPPEVYCGLVCISGCFCKEGLYEAKDGSCVPLELCPVPRNPPEKTCGENEEYTDCGTACPATCSNIGQEQVCTEQCVPGCFCREGLVRNEQGKCIRAVECSQKQCPENEVYSDCVNPCNDCGTRGTCNFLVCNKGCDCRKGYHRVFDGDGNGRCIPAELCPENGRSNEDCGENEVYYPDCAPSCTGTCRAYNNPGIYHCPRCFPGCWCRKGYVKNSAGQCVPPEQCDDTNTTKPTKQCGPDEQYYRCKPTCQNTCENYYSFACLEICIEGCACKQGLVLRKDGKCVKHEECNQLSPTSQPTQPIKQCGPDEQYYRCKPTCQNTCANYYSLACLDICIAGCACRQGLVLRSDGKCVKHEECNKLSPTSKPTLSPTQSPSCGKNEVYYTDCAPSCTGTCYAYNHPGIYNCPRCFPGCWCRKGFVKNNYGQCVPPDQCDDTSTTKPINQCGPDEQYYRCKPTCKNTCENIYSNACVDSCIAGCACKQGLLLRKDGKCVKQVDCNQLPPTSKPTATPTQTPSCGKNEQYYRCRPTCKNTCENYQAVNSIACPRICIAGCSCKEGFVLRNDGKCVKPEKCNKSPPTIIPTTTPTQTPSCGKNQQYYRCKPTCKNTCENYQAVNSIACPRICIKGCACKKGFVLRSDGKCVKPEKCNKSPPTKPMNQCGLNEEYYNCIPTCKNTCENYQAVRPICPLICIKGCACKKGFVKRSDGKCVEPEECTESPPPTKPTTTPTQTPSCGKNEQYYNCKPTCKNTCENYQAMNGLCPRICNKGCACKNGFVLRSDGKCVKPEKCNQLSPTPKPTKPNNQQCGADEEYYRCRPTCKNTCENYQVKNTRFCPRICIRGCACKKGLVKRKDGKCVKPEECKATTPVPTERPPQKCGKDEQYHQCVPVCNETCDTYNLVLPCPFICRAGCFCKEGMIKNKDGKCVKPSECPSGNPPPTDVPPPSNSVCMQPKEVGPCRAIFPRFFYNQQTGQCEPFNYGGCKGNKNNFERKEDCEITCGTGPKPPSTNCGKDEQHYACVPNCHNTCDTYHRKGPCPLYCVSGCYCKEGMVKNREGKCVKPTDCPSTNPPVTGTPPPQCSMPMCATGCEIDYTTKPCPSCSCSSTPPPQCSMPVCDSGCQIDYTTKPCPSCSCSGTPPPQCSMPMCGSGCQIDYNSKPCPSCSCPEPPEQCGENEVYYNECAPVCGGICENFQKRPLLNCRRCSPGCWCKEGLVKRKDGKCVPKDQCDGSSEPPEQCGENEKYYKECAPSCGGTCETYDKLPVLNCRRCSPGCWCKEGQVKRKDGKCVPKDQCDGSSDVTPTPFVPVDSCREDEVYLTCGSACPTTCATLRRTDFACIALCVPGCFCKQGLVRNDEGECVGPEQCPQNTCGEDEEYTDCGTACPATCSNMGQDQVCTDQCVPGCFCRQGLVRNDLGKCVEVEECPRKTCNKDEEYRECGSSCPPTCSTLGQPQICTKECVAGCFCTEGLVKNDQGECVKPKDCPQDQNPPTCGENEEYMECGSACPATCSNIGQDRVCTKQCVPGCFCREGMVKNDMGDCVEPEECPQKQPEECGEDERYYDCVPSCGGTCGTYNKTDIIRCLPCGPGCWCNEGLVKNNEGKCIPPEQCEGPKGPTKMCGINEIYYDRCAPSCKGRCDTYDQIVECPECRPGCWCKKGYLKNHYGKCVPKNKCNKKHKTCPVNQKHYDCMPDCRNRCNPPDVCAAVCKSGCFCKEGLVMREDGKCVREKLCKKNPPKPQCGPDQEYYDCYQRCKNSCATRNGVCTEDCESGCFCKRGMMMDSEGNCVQPNECDAGECSGQNEAMTSCAKPKWCNTCGIRGNCKLKQCIEGCDCKDGHYRDESGVCIPQDQCPQDTTAGGCSGQNEAMTSCSKPKWCNTCGIRGNCKLKECKEGCDCKDGHYRDENGVCIPQDQCPQDTTGSPPIQCSTPKCDGEGCSLDYTKKPCPSCRCTGTPVTIRCSTPRCDGEGCSIDYSTKPCPSCSCKGNSNTNSGQTNTDNWSYSYDGSSYSEESFSSNSETEIFESGSMSQSDSGSWFVDSSSGNEIDSEKNSLEDSETGYSSASSSVSEWSSDISSDSGDSLSSSSSRSSTVFRTDGNSAGNEIDSVKNSSEELAAGYSSMSSGAEEWSSGLSYDSVNSVLGSETWFSSSSSRKDASLEEIEIDSSDELVDSEDISSSGLESGYSSESEMWSEDMSYDSENSESKSSAGSESWSSKTSNFQESSYREETDSDNDLFISEDNSLDEESSSSGSNDRSSSMAANSEESYEENIYEVKEEDTETDTVENSFTYNKQEEEFEESYEEDIFEVYEEMEEDTETETVENYSS